MTTIKVRAYSGTPTITLDAGQSKLFRDELKRVRKFYPASKGLPAAKIGPDCVITIRTGRGTSEYQLFSRAVLVETRTKKKWQFYFGLLLMEWLYP